MNNTVGMNGPAPRPLTKIELLEQQSASVRNAANDLVNMTATRFNILFGPTEECTKSSGNPNIQARKEPTSLLNSIENNLYEIQESLSYLLTQIERL